MQIGIVGAGASGMMAAIAAAREGAEVTLLEGCRQIGKKLLATGNGRCNLSNLDFDANRDYRGHDTGRLSGWFSRFGVRETISFFESLGLVLIDKNGYLYPRSLQAAAVLDSLQGELFRLKVRQITDCRIVHIQKKKRFLLTSGQETFSFDRIILACGSSAGLARPDPPDGFALAGQMGLLTYPLLPALTALRCRERFFGALAGVRCQARIDLHVSDRVYSEKGELQLTDYGISGIPVFQLSRFASEALADKQPVSAVLDFLPEYPKETWDAFLTKQMRVFFGKPIRLMGCGMLPAKVVTTLMKLCGIRQEELVCPQNQERIRQLFQTARALGVTVYATNPLRQSQVCMGGVALSELDDDLGAIRVPGLYLCGEMLDVDGRCGGYNLQWAFTSGYTAGRAAAGGSKKAERNDYDQNTTA